MLKNYLLKMINLTIAFVIFIFCIRYIFKVTQDVSLNKVVYLMQSMDNKWIILALMLTAVNYLLVTGYDIITVKQLNLKLPHWHVSVISLISFILNNNLGLGAIMGGLLRYRFLSRLGVPPLMIGSYMILFSWIYWLGLIVLAAAVFLFLEPSGYKIILPFAGMKINASLLGWLAIFLFFMFISLSLIKKFFHLKTKFLFPIAPPKIFVFQTALSSLDWILLAVVFYLLLPIKSVEFLNYLPIFFMAQIFAVVSHVPAGAGVFDSIMFFYFKPVVGANNLISWLILFRVIYFLAPLGFGIGLFLLYEIYCARRI